MEECHLHFNFESTPCNTRIQAASGVGLAARTCRKANRTFVPQEVLLDPPSEHSLQSHFNAPSGALPEVRGHPFQHHEPSINCPTMTVASCRSLSDGDRQHAYNGRPSGKFDQKRWTTFASPEWPPFWQAHQSPHLDNDFAFGSPGIDVGHRLPDRFEGKDPIHNRAYDTGIDEGCDQAQLVSACPHEQKRIANVLPAS